MGEPLGRVVELGDWRDRMRYRDHLISLDLATKTIRTYELQVARAERWAAANGADLLDLTPTQARELGDTWPRTYASRRPLRVALRHFWACHEVTGQESSIVVPKRPRSQYRGLPDDDVHKLLRVARRDWPRGAAVYLGIYQGMRRESIAILRWADFNDDMTWVSFRTKGDRVHTMPVCPPVRRALEPHRWPGEYVFPGRFGGHVTTATINNWIDSLVGETDVDRFTPHQMRHTSGGKVYRETGDIYLAAAWLGHADISTTRVYTEVEEHKMLQALEAHDWEDTEEAA